MTMNYVSPPAKEELSLRKPRRTSSTSSRSPLCGPMKMFILRDPLDARLTPSLASPLIYLERFLSLSPSLDSEASEYKARSPVVVVLH